MLERPMLNILECRWTSHRVNPAEDGANGLVL
jgi:hypothetical protein